MCGLLPGAAAEELLCERRFLLPELKGLKNEPELDEDQDTDDTCDEGNCSWQAFVDNELDFESKSQDGDDLGLLSETSSEASLCFYLPESTPESPDSCSSAYNELDFESKSRDGDDLGLLSETSSE